MTEATTGRVHLQPGHLKSLAGEWRQQEWDLRSAEGALSAPDLPGNSASVSVELARFLEAWSVEIAELALAVGLVADGLASASSDFVRVDEGVRTLWV